MMSELISQPPCLGKRSYGRSGIKEVESRRAAQRPSLFLAVPINRSHVVKHMGNLVEDRHASDPVCVSSHVKPGVCQYTRVERRRRGIAFQANAFQAPSLASWNDRLDRMSFSHAVIERTVSSLDAVDNRRKRMSSSSAHSPRATTANVCI